MSPEPVTAATGAARVLEAWPQPDFVESSIAGLDICELDALPDDSIDLLQVVREAEAS